jgi:CelD/BcsL family acetyltransferase involved in cellulose biosynthesis
MAQLTPAMFDASLDDVAEADVMADQLAVHPGHVVRAEIRLSVHEDIAAIERDWREFQERADGTVFQTYEWLSTWQRHIGARRGVRPAVVIGRDARGEIVLLLPLAVERTRVARKLTWLGSELCDYNAPLLAADFSLHVSLARFKQLWSDLLLRLRSHPRLGFDLVHLDQMPAAIGAQRNPLLHLGATCHPNNAFVVSLTDNWEKLYAKRSSSTRRHDRTKRNKLAEHGAVACVHAERPPEIASTLEIMMEQKSRWFAEMGVSNMFAKPGCREFFFDIATNPQTRRITHVSRLDVGGATLATSFGLVFGDSFYYVLASYDRHTELARYAPGIALLHDLLRFAIGKGFCKFDLSVGSERYKHEWSDAELNLYDHMSVTTLRGACAALPLMAVRQSKRCIKSNPALWSAFRRARAFAGSLPILRR